MLLTCKDVNKAYGERIVLKDVSLIIEEKEKTAIVGVNGAGKTTLLKIITGELPADAGTVTMRQGVSIGYLAQMDDLSDGSTVYQEMESVFLPVIERENRLRSIEAEMALLQGEQLDELMRLYGRLTHEFEHMKGYEYKSRIRGVIKGLGFCDADSEQKVGTFSGGQKTRLSLAKLLLTEPDLLLLDEPTNHLDIESIQWLEDFLKNYKESVVIISHDRYFMDKIVTKVIEIENNAAVSYSGNYSAFAAKKEIERDILRKHYENQQKIIKKQEEVIRVLKSYNREKTVKRAESREKLLEKMEKIEKPANLPDSMRIVLAPRVESGNDVLFVDGVCKSFDGETLFSDISFKAFKGDKIALLGANGTGKTTLLRIIMNKLKADGGNITLGHKVVIGYYDQEHKNIDADKTVFDEIADSFPRLSVLEIRNALAAFLFTGDDAFKLVGALSGGERGRVALAKIMLSDANFLILDEPTNHLDISSRAILEEVLRNYEGTILYVSHDRYFINNTATKIITLGKTEAALYLGNYDYYMEKLKQQAELQQSEADEKTKETKTKWIQGKEESQKDRKIKSGLRRAEKEITETEQKIAEIDGELLKPEISADHEALMQLLDEKQALEEKLLSLYAAWEEAAT